MTVENSTMIWAAADIARDLNLEISGASVDGAWVSFYREGEPEMVTLWRTGGLLYNPKVTMRDYRALVGIAKYHNLEICEVEL